MQLSPTDRKTVYGLAQFLRVRHQTVVKAWRDIDAQKSDSEPLIPEEADPLRDPELVSWDPEAKPMAYELRIRRCALNYLNKFHRQLVKPVQPPTNSHRGYGDLLIDSLSNIRNGHRAFRQRSNTRLTGIPVEHGRQPLSQRGYRFQHRLTHCVGRNRRI